jgi:hypothetical protein
MSLLPSLRKFFSMVSFLSTNTVRRNAWYLESGASHHTTSTPQLFSSLTEKDLCNSLDFDDVLFFLGVRGIFLNFWLWRIRAMVWSSRTNKY